MNTSRPTKEQFEKMELSEILALSDTKRLQLLGELIADRILEDVLTGPKFTVTNAAANRRERKQNSQQ